MGNATKVKSRFLVPQNDGLVLWFRNWEEFVRTDGSVSGFIRDSSSVDGEDLIMNLIIPLAATGR